MICGAQGNLGLSFLVRRGAARLTILCSAGGDRPHDFWLCRGRPALLFYMRPGTARLPSGHFFDGSSGFRQLWGRGVSFLARDVAAIL